MTRIFVDTSAWFALFYAPDPSHAAVAAAYSASGHLWYTSNFIVDEILTLLESRVGHGAAVKAGRGLRGGVQAKMIRVEPEDEDQAWGTFQTTKGLSFTDCTSFSVMRRLRISSALTLDSDFRRQGFTILPG